MARGIPSLREVQVLNLASCGYDIRRSAEVVGCSLGTVRTHRANALFTLHAHSLAEAVGIAFRRGLLR